MSEPSPESAPAKLPRNVVALSGVSFLNDTASEMIYPLLPAFLRTTLGASGASIGAIEGLAEATASLLKLVSGRMSDQVPRRKPLVVAGYVIAAVARPLVAVATSAWHVLAVRVSDRIGKGVRTSPRDALLADSTDPSIRGRAYGFHRAADHLGATVGPLLAFALLRWGGLEVRTVFWLAAIPAAIAIVVLLTAVKESPRREPESPGAALTLRRAGPLGRPFWMYLVVMLVFTLGNVTDAFLLLRAEGLGVAAGLLPLLWSAHHAVKAVSSTPGGALSDRLGRKPLLVTGWIWFAAVYAGFAFASAAWHAWALFLAYGLFFGLTEGTGKALVADLAPDDRRGAAFGWFHLTIGFAALPASWLFGRIWDVHGERTAFALGAGVALLAAALLVLLVRTRPPAPE